MNPPSFEQKPATRREFVRTTSVIAGTFALAPFAILNRRADYDIIIRGGTVFDGMGRDGVLADVAIANGRVTAIAPRVTGATRFEINARGLAVAPGFVDIHSHGDNTLWDDPRAESLIRQGITTIVVGQDGGSRAPREGSENGNRSFASFSDLWRALGQLRPAVNVASMIGLGSVRASIVGGTNRPATPEEIARMTIMVREALEDGACGASSGLEYTPGAFASLRELIAVCRPLKDRGLPYATHMRNEDDRLLEAVDESIAVARDAECPLQISHLKTQGPRNWRKLDDVFARIAAANTSGMDVSFDRYPYIAYQTGLSNLFPVWSRADSSQAFLVRLEAQDTKDRIRQETLDKVELIGGWDNVQISGVSNAADKVAEGKRLGAYAASVGGDPYVVAMELLKRNRGSVGMVGFAMSEDNIDRILAHPRGMVCSDGGSYAIEGPARRGHPHPRALGSFPRILSRYVRERRALTLPQAIQKMTSLPASRVKLDRGRLVKGAAADLVVFNANTIEDRATFAEPFAYPGGIKAVIVNGSVSLLDGGRGDHLAGASVRAT